MLPMRRAGLRSGLRWRENYSAERIGLNRAAEAVDPLKFPVRLHTGAIVGVPRAQTEKDFFGQVLTPILPPCEELE